MGELILLLEDKLAEAVSISFEAALFLAGML